MSVRILKTGTKIGKIHLKYYLEKIFRDEIQRNNKLKSHDVMFIIFMSSRKTFSILIKRILLGCCGYSSSVATEHKSKDFELNQSFE